MQLIVCDSTCYILGTISNRAIFYIFKDAAHIVNFAGNLVVIVATTCHLTRQLRKKEPLLISENAIGQIVHLHEKLSTHLQMIWIITVGTNPKTKFNLECHSCISPLNVAFLLFMIFFSRYDCGNRLLHFLFGKSKLRRTLCRRACA